MKATKKRKAPTPIRFGEVEETLKLHCVKTNQSVNSYVVSATTKQLKKDSK